MSKRFAIRSTRPPVQKEGNKIVHGTGEDIPFRHTCELFIRQVDEGQFEFHTGLEERHIKFSRFFDEPTIESLLKQQVEAVKHLGDIFGKSTIRPDNKYFWGIEHDGNSTFRMDNETMATFFDTKEPFHELLYWKITGGGYADEIAPTHENALKFGLPFYMTELEEEAERRTEDVSSKVKALSLLEKLSEKKSTEDMLWMAWMLHPSNMGFTKATPKATLFNAHYEFIEGKLVKKAKKACSKQFIEAYQLLTTNKTAAIAKALVNAGDYFGLVYTTKEGQLATRKNNLPLGITPEEAVEILLKPINQSELELLRQDVEEKIR